MKKILFVLMMFLISIGFVKAAECPHLKNLKIENAAEQIDFGPEIESYLVTIDDGDDHLIINYDAKSEYNITIIGNVDLKKGDKVFIEVASKDNERVTVYTIAVVKKDIKNDTAKEKKTSPFKFIWIAILFIGFLGLVLFFANVKTGN